MGERKPDQDDEDRERSNPYRARLPGFINEEDVGLGDAVTRVARTFGIKPCGGCKRRAAALNRWFVFTGRSR
jgi:hypothetical protein